MLLPNLVPLGAPNPEDLIKLYTENSNMNYLMVNDGVVVNVIVWDGVAQYDAPENCMLYPWDGPADIGWAWVDGKPVNPNPPQISSDPVESDKPHQIGPEVL